MSTLLIYFNDKELLALNYTKLKNFFKVNK